MACMVFVFFIFGCGGEQAKRVYCGGVDITFGLLDFCDSLRFLSSGSFFCGMMIQRSLAVGGDI